MRPEGWNSIEIARGVEGRMFRGVSQLDVDLIEAGADAMLEGLKKQGCWITSKHSSKINFTDDNYIESSPLMAFIKGQRKAGYLVFIPEDGCDSGETLNANALYED